MCRELLRGRPAESDAHQTVTYGRHNEEVLLSGILSLQNLPVEDDDVVQFEQEWLTDPPQIIDPRVTDEDIVNNMRNHLRNAPHYMQLPDTGLPSEQQVLDWRNRHKDKFPWHEFEPRIIGIDEAPFDENTTPEEITSYIRKKLGLDEDDEFPSWKEVVERLCPRLPTANA